MDHLLHPSTPHRFVRGIALVLFRVMGVAIIILDDAVTRVLDRILVVGGWNSTM